MAVLVLLSVRLVLFTAQSAVDVMYWDSWDLYRTVFRGQGWWATFDQQHGPHRQGLGGWMMRGLAGLTRWDSRGDAYLVCGSLIAAAALGAWLGRRVGMRGWALLFVPAVCLNLRQYQMLVVAANPSHGALPLLLLIASALAWFVRREPWRLSLVVTLTAAAVFTGFGLFVGVLVVPLLLVELGHAVRRRRPWAPAGIALLATAGIWAAFLWNYDPARARHGVQFAVDRPVEYLYFAGVMVANGLGVVGDGWFTIGVGLSLLAAAGGVMVVRGWRALRRGPAADPASTAIASLAAFGLLFAADVAAGRTFLGWQLAGMSRYVTLCVPISLAVLFHLGAARPPLGRAAVVVGALLVVGTLALRSPDLLSIEQVRAGCLRWRSAYLETHDELAANRAAHFPIHETVDDDEPLRFLERNGLNLFDPAAFSPANP